MERRIEIRLGDRTFTATLFDTPVADAIWKALPIDSHASQWGDEFYFDTGVEVASGPSRETVDAGDVAYWSPGQALCLFWGPTPMSGPGEIRPASPVAVFGKLDGDPLALASARPGRVVVSKMGTG